MTSRLKLDFVVHDFAAGRITQINTITWSIALTPKHRRELVLRWAKPIGLTP